LSVQAITWALEQTVGSPTGKVVLLCLANYADKHGACFPGQKVIADECEMSIRSVVEWMAKLEGLGLLVRERRFRNNGSRTSDSIILRLPWLEAPTSSGQGAETALGSEQAEKPASPSADDDVHHVQQVHPHTLKGNLKPPNPPAGGFASLWEVWPDEHSGNWDNAEGAWRKLSASQQASALQHADTALSAYRRRQDRIPALVMYLRNKAFEDFENAPPLDSDGYFVIRPDMPEWKEWMGWARAQRGEKGVEYYVKLGFILTKERWPEGAKKAA
jgi:hypothetical protein